MKNCEILRLKLSKRPNFLSQGCAMVGSNEEALLKVIDRIYESIEAPELWPETIYAVGELIGGRRHFWGPDQDISAGVTRSPHELEIGCYGTFFLSRQDLQVLDEYAEEFSDLIIRFLKIVFLSILRSQKEIGAREAIGLKIAERYLDALQPLSRTSTLPAPGLASRRLIAELWEDGRIFSGDKLHYMRILAPHLERAVRLQMQWSAADLRTDILSGVLDSLTHGVVLVDHSGLPVSMNRRAKEIMETSNGLRLSRTGIAGHRPCDTESIRDLINGALSAGKQGLLAISRVDGLRPLLLVAVPMKPSGNPGGSSQFAQAVVFICDPDRTDNPTVETLQRAFDLTYREAQVAIAIARGHGLQAAADGMGVALTTARSQLQQAFAKTGTSHQAELAALVHRTLTHLRYD
jgi:DNA-binding CsgD family transcriptional regulator